MLQRLNRNGLLVHSSDVNSPTSHQVGLCFLTNLNIMEAKELRIGNIIKSAKSNLYHWAVTVEDFAYITENPNNYEGVELTEDWLLKWGFYKDEEHDEGGMIDYRYKFKEIHEGVVIDFMSDWITEDEFGAIFCKTRTRLNYIHQLQNLYYCVTGKEITIKT